ncbi:MAG: hypothetical protein NXI24_12840 [bacterium]|nr:hypothetical protein [bacterium]
MSFFQEEAAIAECLVPVGGDERKIACDRFDTARYRDPNRFELEQSRIFAGLPLPLRHCSEITRHGAAGEVSFGGFVWSSGSEPAKLEEKPNVSIEAKMKAKIAAFLGGALLQDLQAIDLSGHRVVATSTRDWRMNWKLAIEAALESYHFRVAHAKTIGGRFADRAGSFLRMQRHNRFIVPRREAPAAIRCRSLRDIAFVTYSIFPNSLLFVNRRHCDWMRVVPLAPGRSRLVIQTLMPRSRAADSRRAREYARVNHEFTRAIVAEDSEINESQQANFEANPGVPVFFGGMEGALTEFNRQIDAMLV